jgi:hypothetical protein
VDQTLEVRRRQSLRDFRADPHNVPGGKGLESVEAILQLTFRDSL